MLNDMKVVNELHELVQAHEEVKNAMPSVYWERCVISNPAVGGTVLEIMTFCIYSIAPYRRSMSPN